MITEFGKPSQLVYYRKQHTSCNRVDPKYIKNEISLTKIRNNDRERCQLN